MSYRILFVIDNYDISGAEKVAINFMRHCAAAGIDAAGVVCIDDKLGVERSGANLIHLNPGSAIGGTLLQRVVKGARASVRCIAHAHEADALIAVTPPAAIVAAIAGFVSGKPAIPWLHYDIDGISRETVKAKGRVIRNFIQYVLYNFFVPSFENIIFISQSSLESLKKRKGKNRHTDKWVVLPNVFDSSGFDMEAQSSTALRMQALKAEAKPLFLFLGRLCRQKHWEDAIAAAERLKDAGFDFNLAFIGDGLEFERFSIALQSSPAQDKLHYLGPDTNPMPSLQMADALIMTSLYEAWPTVILEAFNLGVLVIAYDCPSGPREMLGDGRRGIVTAEHPQALADAVLDFFGNPDREKIKSAMEVDMRRFLENHLPEVACAQWKLYFDRLLSP